MYGYIRPQKSELKMREYELYRAAYCGLCHSLAREFGPLARYTVSYDMTFLYMILQKSEDHPELKLCRCPAHPLRRRCAACSMEGASLAAAATVLLFCHKLRDDLRDEGFFKRLASRILLLVFAGPFRKAKHRYPELSNIISLRMNELSALETERCASVDRAAEPFAAMCAALVDGIGEGRRAYALNQLMYHIGRVIYFTDAVDDLPEDVAANRYNPIAVRFGIDTRDGLISRSVDMQKLADASLAAAASAYLDLDRTPFSPIIENVLLLGIPAAFSAAIRGEKLKLKEKRNDRSL